MRRRFTAPSLLCFSSILLGLVTGCGGATVGSESGGDASAQGPAVEVAPSTIAVAPGTETQFAAAVTGTSVLAVTWVVDESSGGTVSTAGLYQAPQQGGTFHVRAVSVADSSVSGTAVVTVTAGSSSGGSSSGGTSSGGSSSGGSTATAPCANTTPRTTGTTYYYCDCQSGATSGCIAGSDSSTGTSPTTPRRSFSDAVARFNGMNAGDTVAFCRGGSWTSATGVFTNTRCTASSPCDFRDYTPTGMSSAPRPLFAPGSGSFVNASQTGTRQGFRFWNLDIRHSGGGYSFNLGDITTDVDICNVNMEGGDIGLLEQMRNARITLRNSRLANFSTDAILAGSMNLVIDSNVIIDSGPNSNRSHAIYLGGGAEQNGGQGPANERVTNNRIIAGSTSGRMCQGTILTVHGRHTNAVIENNLIIGGQYADGGCFGLQVVNGGYPYACWTNGTSIRRNRILLQQSGQGIGVTNCDHCTVSDNVVAIQSGSYGIMIPESASRGSVTCGSGYVCAGQTQQDSLTTNVTVQNNTVYMPASSNGWNLSISKEGSGYIVENNALFEGPTPALGGCLQVTQSATRNSNNYCRSGSGATATQLWVAPTFVETADYRPASGSPLIGAGSSSNFSATASSSVWSATDQGIARTAPTDAGAFIH